jgi:hypothetical protein
VSIAECECGDRLQMAEHIFWDCKLYEGQRARVMDILSENSKKEYSKVSYRALKARGKKFVQGICYFINKTPKFIKKKRNRSKCTKY